MGKISMYKICDRCRFHVPAKQSICQVCGSAEFVCQEIKENKKQKTAKSAPQQVATTMPEVTTIAAPCVDRTARKADKQPSLSGPKVQAMLLEIERSAKEETHAAGLIDSNNRTPNGDWPISIMVQPAMVQPAVNEGTKNSIEQVDAPLQTGKRAGSTQFRDSADENLADEKLANKTAGFFDKLRASLGELIAVKVVCLSKDKDERIASTKGKLRAEPPAVWSAAGNIAQTLLADDLVSSPTGSLSDSHRDSQADSLQLAPDSLSQSADVKEQLDNLKTWFEQFGKDGILLQRPSVSVDADMQNAETAESDSAVAQDVEAAEAA